MWPADPDNLAGIKDRVTAEGRVTFFPYTADRLLSQQRPQYKEIANKIPFIVLGISTRKNLPSFC